MEAMTTSGKLVVSVYQEGDQTPISGAQVEISDMKGNVIRRLQTDEFGNIQTITLPALSNYNTRSEIAVGDQAIQGKYIVTVKHPNYEPIRLEGVRVIDGSKAIPEIPLASLRSEGYPVIKTVKLQDPQPPVKKLDQNPFNVSEFSTNPLSFIHTLNLPIAHHHNPHPPIGLVIPETIRLHLFSDEGSTSPARTVVVNFVDYIKGVVHDELEGFTEDEAIRANIIAIVSFTLNRYYTQHYRKQNKTYHITNDKTVDHGYLERPTPQEPLVNNTEAFFSKYVEYPNSRYFPFLTQYCDTSCANEGKLDKEKSRVLSQEGKKHNEIIKHFYGENYNIVSAAFIMKNNQLYTFIRPLKLGDSGDRVSLIQTYFDAMGRKWNNIIYKKVIEENGYFGEKTEKAVKWLQKNKMHLPEYKVNGIIDQGTWFKILTLYFIALQNTRNYNPNGTPVLNRSIGTTSLPSIQPGYLWPRQLFPQFGLLCKTIPTPYGLRQYCYYSYFYELYNPYMYYK